MTDSRNIVEVRSLSKTYRSGRRSGDVTAALQDVSFELARGGSLAIVGESGSGKSTCARIVAGLEEPSSGTLVIGGDEVDLARPDRRSRKRRARQVQMVFQDPYSSLDRRQTVEDCLAECVNQHVDLDSEARQRRVRELIEQVGLDERHMRVRPKSLSGGERQRVAIARALTAEPDVLILDEAVAALDVSIQAQVLNLLADIRARTSISYLFISHDLAVVQRICDDVIVMCEGRIVERGGVGDVLSRPQEAYTQRLVDSIPREGWKPRRRIGQ